MISHITTRNFNLTEGIKSHLNRKFAHFDKYLDSEDIVNVKLEVQKNRQRVEVTILGTNNSVVRGEDWSEDLYEAIDKVEETVIRNLKKRKEKRIQKHRGAEELIYEAPEPQREKYHKLDSISQEEAYDAMELTDHSFYVYSDKDRDNKICAVYQKNDGEYGVIIFD